MEDGGAPVSARKRFARQWRERRCRASRFAFTPLRLMPTFRHADARTVGVNASGTSTKRSTPATPEGGNETPFQTARSGAASARRRYLQANGNGTESSEGMVNSAEKAVRAMAEVKEPE